MAWKCFPHYWSSMRGIHWGLVQYIPRNMHTVTALLCFVVVTHLTDFPISIRLTSLALWQSNDCPSASKATLMNMDKYLMWIHYERLHNHNKEKHNTTVCIFLGIYCSFSPYGASNDVMVSLLWSWTNCWTSSGGSCEWFGTPQRFCGHCNDIETEHWARQQYYYTHTTEPLMIWLTKTTFIN